MKTKYVVIISVCVLAIAITLFLSSNNEDRNKLMEYDNTVESGEEVAHDNEDTESGEEDSIESDTVFDNTITINGWTEETLHNYYDICSFGYDVYTGDEYPVYTVQSVSTIKELESINGSDAIIFHTADLGTYEANGVTYCDNSYSITFDYDKVFYVYEEYGCSYALESANDYSTLLEYYETGDVSILN